MAAPTLRSIMPAEAYFWKADVQAQRKCGFFFHLPPRQAWTTKPDVNRLPAERSPVAPGFRWNDGDAEAYLADSQRARYLRASAIANPPPDYTPLFAIQYAIQRCPVFFTRTQSQIIFATPCAFYHGLTDEFGCILGRDHKDHSKLGSANWLWDRGSLDKGRDDRRAKDAQMGRFQRSSLLSLYNSIVQRCCNGELQQSYEAVELRDLIPRPSVSAARSVGSQLGGGASADCPSRSGESHRPRLSKKRRLNREKDQQQPYGVGEQGQNTIGVDA
ncbi:unnamed protein product [Zymoseptoria tritici ST99CH_3D1]|nr:unnamed protein product [Zymoseptoria tritici ST99CH_3D1]